MTAVVMRLITTLIVMLAASVLLASQAPESAALLEPRSGTPFPASIVPPGGTTPHTLVGIGLRDRTIFRVKIYAFGMYVDPAGARAALRGFAGQPSPMLERDERFYRRVLDLDFALTLRLVMLRTVGGDDIARAFGEALTTRLERVERATKDRSGLLALETFRRFFDVQEVRKGTEIVFSCNAQGRLAGALGGVRRPVLESKPLCRALLDVYLGVSPISAAGKKTVIAGFPALLAGPR